MGNLALYKINHGGYGGKVVHLLNKLPQSHDEARRNGENSKGKPCSFLLQLENGALIKLKCVEVLPVKF